MPAPLVALECARWVDAASVFSSWLGDERFAFWLDAGPAAAAGWSWLGTGTPDDADAVREVACGSPPAGPRDEPPSAGRFTGGWVGWIGYDAAAERVGAPARHDRLAPPEVWLRVERMVAFDHAARRVWAHAADEASARALAALVDAVGSDAEGRARGPVDPGRTASGSEATARHTPAQYAELIARCRAAIREGDAYQLCLTTRFEVDGAADPVSVYTRLRSAQPAHHGGLIRAGETALLSASPEQFLEVDGPMVRTRPIKGTRPRGADPAADRALAVELHTDAKERAENVMIVDLMRNDLSRVCEAGSVGVDALLAVESYPAVHQLVSTVSGRLVAGSTVDDLLAAAFPAGSMTGAPKLAAMTILHELERAPRGVFAGCFGWVGVDGALDLAMVIRSIVVHPGGAYVGAGGGITWRSDAVAEVAEVGIKARGPLAALGARLPQGW